VVEAGQVARQVYLPRGEWYDWYSSERYDGTRFLRVDTPMDHIPLFARAGAVVPMWPQAPASTDGHHPDTVELHVFVPTADGRHESVLREDDGLTFAAAEGRHLRTTLVLERSGDGVTVRATVDGDGYPEFRRQAFRLVMHGAAPEQVLLDGVAVEAEDRDGARAFTLPNGGQPFEVGFRAG
jgi:alpha-glucosidase